VIGSGYVGLVAAACFADMGHQVVCVDNDEARVKLLCEGGVPIFEKHLPELLAKHRGGRVVFTTHLGEAVERSEAVFIAVGTPQGDGGAADLSYVEAVVAEIARAIKSYKVIVEKSTVPVYTNDWIRRVLHRHGVEAELFDVVSNPEFLREGTAVVDFLHPDRIVVGATNDRSAEILRRIYEPLTAGSYYAQPGAVPGACSTAAGAAAGHFNAKRGDHQARLECVSGHEDLVHQRRGEPGRGGGCGHRGHCCRASGSTAASARDFFAPDWDTEARAFPRTSPHFIGWRRSAGVDLQLLEEVRKINDTQREVFFNKVRSVLWTLRGKRLAALGLAFKGDTDDIRDSPAIAIIKQLLHAGAIVTAYDPAAMERAKEVLPPAANMQYAGDLYQAAKDADAC
jgi:UDPglucose 6-dehydrogenase